MSFEYTPIPLMLALECLDCEHIVVTRGDVCPRCGNLGLLPVRRASQGEQQLAHAMAAGHQKLIALAQAAGKIPPSSAADPIEQRTPVRLVPRYPVMRAEFATESS